MRRSCAKHSTIVNTLASLSAAVMLALLTSCGDGPAKARESDAAVKGAAPDSTADNADFADAAADLQAAFNRKPDTDPAPAPRRQGPIPNPREKLEPVPKRPAAANTSSEPPARVYHEPPVAAITAPLPATIDGLASRRDELVQVTARTLRAWADAGGDPTIAASQFAALAAFPDARPAPLPAAWLNSDQQKSADALAGLMRDIAAQGPRGLDSATVGALLSQRAGELGSTPAPPQSAAVVQTGPVPTTSVLTVPTVALCRKVESFGVYEPVGSTTVQVGRAHTMIVYTEVEGFKQRATSSDERGPGFSSELSQTVMLYHDADGLLAWTRPEVTVRDATRRQRRDYYLVQRLELPPTLTIGKYNLKILVRDKLTGAEAEMTVPINVVASTAASQR